MRLDPPRILLLATAITALAACEDPIGVDDIRVPIEPKAIYRLAWQDMVQCSERTRPFDGIRWFQTSYFPGQPTVVGQWNSRREITIRADAVFDREVVAHEILHDLLKGDPLHEDPAWEACGVQKGSDTAG